MIGPVLSGLNWGAGRYPSTFPNSSVSILVSPASWNRAAVHSDRACSPNGGAGIAHSSLCHSRSTRSLACNHANAVCTLRRDARAVIRENAAVREERGISLLQPSRAEGDLLASPIIDARRSSRDTPP